MRIGPFSKCEIGSDFWIRCQVKTWASLTKWLTPPMKTFSPIFMAFLSVVLI